MATPNIFLLFTAIPLFFFFFFLSPHCYAQSPAAPAPAAAGTANLTAILVKGGQFTTFLRLLSATQVGNQIQNQLNSSTEGMTVFSPTDNAFQSLKSGTINGLSTQQQVQLVLYHVLPKFYTFATFQTASNPVRTQATGQNGGVFGLNITSVGNNQANVSSGLVETQINNALRQDFPLAVYQVDRVLLPEELFEAKSPVASPAAPEAKGKSAGGESSEAAADGPAASKDDSNGGYGASSAGWGLVVGAGLVSIGLLS